MTKALRRAFDSISSVFENGNKSEKANNLLPPLKLYTFMIRGESVRKSINIKAIDRQEAEKKAQAQYPDCKIDFLWELIRSSY